MTDAANEMPNPMDVFRSMFGDSNVVTEEQIKAAAEEFAKNPSPKTSIPGNAMPRPEKEPSKTTAQFAALFAFVRKASRSARRALPKILAYAAAGAVVASILGLLLWGFMVFFQYLLGINTILAWSVVGALVAQAVLMVAASLLKMWTTTLNLNFAK